MKPSTLRKTADPSTKNRPSNRSAQAATALAEEEKPDSEESPWVAEIENALSPYWSSRLSR